MKTIIFFDRSNLTKLYGELDFALKEDYNIIHIAYDKNESNLLREHYKVNESRIINYKENFRLIEKKISVNKTLLEEIDNVIIEQTEGRFCLNAMIQSDRAMAYKTYNECLLIAEICYKFWNKIISKYKPQFLFHEGVSLFMNAIASVLAKKENCLYCGFSQTYGFNDINFFFDTFDGGSPAYLNPELKVDRNKCKEFLDKYRSEKKVGAMLKDSEIFKQPSRIVYLYKAKRHQLVKTIKKNKFCQNLEDYVDNYLFRYDPDYIHYKNLSRYKEIKWDSFNITDNYFYYPLHLEPEASVLYSGDGLYENQIKLVQNIAAQLPPDYLLYVKDHPHDIGYRSVEDYKKLQSIPNIKLLPPILAGQELIKYAKAIITINGTTGFEALLDKKFVFCFGKPSYGACKNVFYVKNIKDLYKCIKKYQDLIFDDEILLDFLQQWFYWSFPGNITYFLSPIDSSTENILTVINSFKLFLERF